VWRQILPIATENVIGWSAIMPSKDAPMPAYDPISHRLPSFSSAIPGFLEGSDTPRDFLERGLDAVYTGERDIKAFVRYDADAARIAADQASERYRAGSPLSPVDGMPFGVKDMYDTADMPTEMGTPIHKGRQPEFDAAHVDALRRGGAVMLGKTVTSQFAIAGAGPTRNPFDTTRTPGATSSGSAAAVGAGMVPVATGSHSKGSVIRPAAYCANFAIKPTFGALNRGGIITMARTTDHLGIMAGSIEDMWATAWQIAEVAGGDPGYPGLYGAADPAPPRKPECLIKLDTSGWAVADPGAKAALEQLIETLRGADVTIIDRSNDPSVAAYEETLSRLGPFWAMTAAYEQRWPMRLYVDRYKSQLDPTIVMAAERGKTLRPDDYREALAYREGLRAEHAALADKADGFITLSAPGVAPPADDVGDPVFNEPSSLLGVPAMNLPLLAQDGLPLGVQLLGFKDCDHALTGLARWMTDKVLSA
jgi:Asp-tRNA(Asn)/Glu-tRNA(Gln) amidotransferase A subunit family amidase